MCSRNEYKSFGFKDAESSRRTGRGCGDFCGGSGRSTGLCGKQHIDVVLLGPQVRFMEADFKKKMEPKGIPVGVIPMSDYGMMNGAKVLDFANQLMEG